MTRKHRTFTKEFKLETLELSRRTEVNDRDIERDMALPRGTLYRWRRELEEAGDQAFPGRGCLKVGDEELRRLRRENALLKEERDILKKALGIFSQDRNN